MVCLVCFENEMNLILYLQKLLLLQNTTNPPLYLKSITFGLSGRNSVIVLRKHKVLKILMFGNRMGLNWFVHIYNINIFFIIGNTSMLENQSITKNFYCDKC